MLLNLRRRCFRELFAPIRYTKRPVGVGGCLSRFQFHHKLVYGIFISRKSRQRGKKIEFRSCTTITVLVLLENAPCKFGLPRCTSVVYTADKTRTEINRNTSCVPLASIFDISGFESRKLAECFTIPGTPTKVESRTSFAGTNESRDALSPSASSRAAKASSNLPANPRA